MGSNLLVSRSMYMNLRPHLQQDFIRRGIIVLTDTRHLRWGTTITIAYAGKTGKYTWSKGCWRPHGGFRVWLEDEWRRFS